MTMPALRGSRKMDRTMPVGLPLHGLRERISQEDARVDGARLNALETSRPVLRYARPLRQLEAFECSAHEQVCERPTFELSEQRLMGSVRELRA